MKRLVYIVVILISVAGYTYGQDFHFSQFNNAPLLLNPATAGSYQGDYRANLNYKNQWSGISNPYRTLAASFDMPVLRNFNGYKITGAGISILSDKAGKSGYGFTQVNLVASQAVAVSRFQELSAGLSFGYGQVSANFANLRWDRQYNGIEHDPNLPTGEGSYLPKSSYFDVGAGVLARFFSDGFNPTESEVGISVQHVTRPWQGTLSPVNNDVLRLKYIVHGMYEIPFGRYGDPLIIPSVYMAKQGPSYEITGGVSVKGILGTKSLYTGYNKNNYYLAGLFYRYEDAIILMLGYKWNEMLQANISYDINFSTLSPASQTRGGLELSLIWQGEFGYNARSVNTIRKR